MRIVILTNTYPYFPGEQFFEDEIAYWAERAEATVTLMPAIAAGEPRALPPGITVDTALASGRLAGRLVAIFVALFGDMFRSEIGHLWRTRKLGFRTALRALLHSSKVVQQANRLMRYATDHGGIDLAYCYWNETQSYAALLAKTKGCVRRVVSRAHGIDLHEFRRYREYMPLKRQFIHDYDRIFVTSSRAAAYLQATYGASPDKVQVSPLGVPLDGALASPSPAGAVHIVSVSYCHRVKRLDKIVDALVLFARQHQEVTARWTHIGGGPLFEGTKALAQRRLGEMANMSFEFTGDVPHEDVRRFYLDTPVDVLVNASESEGTPVAIQEAMSTGVPVVAPDVGGISCAVSNRCGALLRGSPDGQEIADAIVRVVFGAERDALRANARSVIEQKFSAARNYRDFIVNVLSVGAL